MPDLSAYLLVSHGSLDPRPQVSIAALARRFAQKMQHAVAPSATIGADSPIVAAPGLAAFPTASAQAQPLVGIAALECHPLPLHQQIEQFSDSVQLAFAPSRAGSVTPCKIVVLPLFLLPGVHVMNDLPREMALAQQAIGTAIDLDLRPAIGSHPGLARVVSECMVAQPAEAWILLSHGSRRSTANQPVEGLAERLGAVTAYWSVPPTLESRLQELKQNGIRSVGILPYFLFAGGIMDAIAQTVEASQDPTLKLHLMPPLAATELTDLLVDLAQNEVEGRSKR